jgi:hypothetical protein
MVWHQILHSPQCTDDVEEADLFFVPAFREHPAVHCGNREHLFKLMEAENPKLKAYQENYEKDSHEVRCSAFDSNSQLSRAIEFRTFAPLEALPCV